MNNAPIRRYSDKAPPPLTGIEFLRPYSVRNHAVYPPFTENIWHVVNSSKNNQCMATFDTEEKALHHARHLNYLHLPNPTSTEEIKQQVADEKLGGRIIIVIFFALIALSGLVRMVSTNNHPSSTAPTYSSGSICPAPLTTVTSQPVSLASAATLSGLLCQSSSPTWISYSNYAAYARLKDDGLTVWHPAFLKLERTLDACASVYAAFCKRYQSKPKPNPRSRWGVWQLWREVNKSTKSTKRASAQADLFAQPSARYHGGSQNQALEQTVGILRPAVMAQVSKFLRVSQGV